MAVLVPPGQCVFGPTWTSCPLLARVNVSHDTRVFTFSLPDASSPLGLATCACLLAKASEGAPADLDGVVRPYTPVSTNAMLGKFELMVKIYPGGKLSQHFDQLQIGQLIDFKHIEKNVKMQYPFKNHVGMLVGGTGITPMIQALHAVLGTASDQSRVCMLYGSKTATDILGKETLDEWSSSFPSRLSVHHVLSHEDADSAWRGKRGFFSEEMLAAVVESGDFPAPDSASTIFVCGPPALYDAMCGPRDSPELTGLLAKMGYSAEQIYKF